MLELHAVIELTGAVGLVFKELPFDDPKQRQPDIAGRGARLGAEVSSPRG